MSARTYGPEEQAKLKRIVDEGYEYNCPSIEPQGTNEPLLIKDFHKYIKYAHDS